MDVAFLQFVVEELLYCFVFYLVHWVHFAVYCFGCILFEFDRVVPGSFWRESFRLLFAEHFGELLVFCWDFYLLHILLRLDCEFGGGCSCHSTIVFHFLGLCDYWILSRDKGIYRPEDNG